MYGSPKTIRVADRVKLVFVSDSALKKAYRRVREALFRGESAGGRVNPDDEGLVVVVSSYDDVESCTAALERGAVQDPRWSAGRHALLRHPLVVPARAIQEIMAICAQEGYVAVPSSSLCPPAGTVGDLGTGEVLLVLARSQMLDALHCSQERSRMAGLAQRHDGRALGWDALQPDPERSSPR